MASSKHDKSKIRIYLEYIPFLLLYRTLRLMPYRMARSISEFLVGLLYYVDRKHTQRSIRNILHAGFTSDRAEAERLTRRTYREFGKLLVEIVKADQMYRSGRITMTGAPETVAYLDPERNPGSRQTILVTAHLGNWEVAGTAFAEATRTPMTSLMRSFANPLIGKLILAHRQGESHHLVDKTRGVRPVLKALNDGETVTMLIDQHAAGNEGVECEFFGHPARVHMTPALLHLKSGVPILPEITFRTGDDFEFAFEVGELIRYTPTGDKDHDVRCLTQKCISAVEELIRRHPEQWLWAPRHWLDLDRRGADRYRNWRPAEGSPGVKNKKN